MNLLILLILLTLQFSDAATPNLPVSTVVLTVSDTNEGTPRFTFSEITGRYYVCNVLGGNWTINTYDGVGARLKSVPLDLPCMKVHVDENENVYLLRGITDNMHFDMLDSDLNLVSSAVYAAQSMKLSGNTMWLSGAGQNNFIGVAVPDFIPVGAISVPGIVSISDSAIDSAGYYYVFGLNALSNATIVKFDSAGIPVWTKLIPTALVRPSPVSINYNPVTDELICSINSFGTVLSYPSCDTGYGCTLVFSVLASNGQLSWTYRPVGAYSVSAGAVIDYATGDIYFAYIGDWSGTGKFGYFERLSSSGVLLSQDNQFQYYAEILITPSRIVCALHDRAEIAVARLPTITMSPRSSATTRRSSAARSTSVSISSSLDLSSSEVELPRSAVPIAPSRSILSKSRSALNDIPQKTVSSFKGVMEEFLSKYLILIVAILLAVIAAGVSLCIYRRRSTVTRSKTTTTKSRIKTTESRLTAFTTMPGTTSLMGTSTAVNTDMGLALPGYLYQRPNMDYFCVQELARGGGGVVYLARPFSNALKPYGSHIIVKQMKVTPVSSSEMESFHQEIAIMNDLRNSPFVATILGYSDNPCSIVMKYYELGSLQAFIKNPLLPVSARVVFSFTSNVASGLQLIHSRGIAHCDIKLDNILLD
eukprot:Partr_v1_DN27423_c0_g1_i2_m71970